jgi:uncharacterized paraquat-inducible protein A
MLAAMSFDPRMIWETRPPKEHTDEVSSH